MSKTIEISISVSPQYGTIVSDTYELSSDFDTKTEEEQAVEIDDCIADFRADYVHISHYIHDEK